jgi:hypothetical protein
MPIDSNDLNWGLGDGFTLHHGRRIQAIVCVVTGFDLSEHVAGEVRGWLDFGHGEPYARQGCRVHSCAGAPQPKNNNASRVWRASGAFFQTLSPYLKAKRRDGSAAWMLARQADQWAIAPLDVPIGRASIRSEKGNLLARARVGRCICRASGGPVHLGAASNASLMRIVQ